MKLVDLPKCLNGSEDMMHIPYDVKYRVTTDWIPLFDPGTIVKRLPKELYDTWGEKWIDRSEIRQKADDQMSVAFCDCNDEADVYYLTIEYLEDIEE